MPTQNEIYEEKKRALEKRKYLAKQIKNVLTPEFVPL